MLQGKIVRVARPTDQLDQVVRFYTNGLGLQILYRLENHEGVDVLRVKQRLWVLIIEAIAP